MDIPHTPRHRHFLAFPVFIVLLGGALLMGALRLQADVFVDSADVHVTQIRATGGDRAFSFPDGLYGSVREDGVLLRDDSGLSLQDGVMIAASQGVIPVQVDKVRLLGFHGGMLVTKNGQKFSVMTLTAPVLLSRGDFRMIIPQGMQVDWTSSDEIPSTFQMEHLLDAKRRIHSPLRAVLEAERDRLAALPQGSLPLFPPSSALPSISQLLMLPGSSQRMDRETDRSQLAALQVALIAGDKSANQILAEDRMRLQLSSPHLPDAVLPILLANAERIPSAAHKLMGYLQNPDLWLLLSFHDQYRRAAWADAGPITMPLIPRQQRWMELPLCDNGQPIPARMIEQWGSEVATYVQSLPEPHEFVLSLLRLLRDERAFVEEQGYPERLRRYAKAIQTIVGPVAPGLTAEGQSLYAQWLGIDDIPPYADPPPPPDADFPEFSSSSLPSQPSSPSDSISSSSKPVLLFDSPATEAHARQMLLDAGAVITLTTDVHAEAPTRVRVTNLLVASDAGDSPFDIVFNPESRQVTDIHRAGQLLPYPLELGAFVEWAKNGQ